MIQKILKNIKTIINPSYVEVQFKLAQNFFLEQRYFEAVALYRTCLALDEIANNDIYLKLAEAYYNLGLYQTAAETLEKADCAENVNKSEIYGRIMSDSHKGNEGLKDISHHTYIRLKILGDHIKEHFGEDLSDVSILDIGGGAGYLACFLPEAKYVLAEPTINNISALDLPFDKKTFDCVVSCHVFEHIEENEKYNFLDQLCKLAKSNVLLLNPFLMGDEYLDKIADEDLQLIWDITGAPWAQEHIECGNPSLNLVKDYAKTHNYPLNIHANNSHTFGVIYVYMEYFAVIAQKYEEFKKINRLFNNIDHRLMSNEIFPNDFICNIDVRKSREE